MFPNSLALAAVLVALTPTSDAINAKSYTSWDCCKPACGWLGNNGGAQGLATTCDINNNPLSNAGMTPSGCETSDPNSGASSGFLCDTYQPTPVAEDMSYGFALSIGGNAVADCCKCYQLLWTSGNAVGKSMVVQVVNAGSPAGAAGAGDLVILTPGGGGGGNIGCRSQYGTLWGDDLGGVASGSECASLPQNLQGGCYWRYNWGRGGVNGWDITYEQTQCPSRLTSISGCTAY